MNRADADCHNLILSRVEFSFSSLQFGLRKLVTTELHSTSSFITTSFIKHRLELLAKDPALYAVPSFIPALQSNAAGLV